MMTIISRFVQNAQKYPSKTCVIHANTGNSLTYSELNEKSDIIARELILNGVKKGNNVSMVCSNSLNAVIAYVGILKTGACIILMNPYSSAESIKEIIQFSESNSI